MSKYGYLVGHLRNLFVNRMVVAVNINNPHRQPYTGRCIQIIHTEDRPDEVSFVFDVRNARYTVNLNSLRIGNAECEAESSQNSRIKWRFSFDLPILENAASPKHREQMLELALFIGAEKITYTDRGNGERYDITKNDIVFTINACGNSKDGGFLSVGTFVANK